MLSFQEYTALMESAGNLSGLPHAWLRLIVQRGGGQASEVETTTTKVKNGTALKKVVGEALAKAEGFAFHKSGGPIGVGIFYNDDPLYLIIGQNFQGSRPTFAAYNPDGERREISDSKWMKRTNFKYDSQGKSYKVREDYLHKFMRSDHNKGEMAAVIVDLVTAAGLEDATLDVRLFRSDKNRKVVSSNRVEARRGMGDAVDPGLAKVQKQVLIDKAKSHAIHQYAGPLQAKLDIFTRFMNLPTMDAKTLISSALDDTDHVLPALPEIDKKKYDEAMQARSAVGNFLAAIKDGGSGGAKTRAAYAKTKKDRADGRGRAFHNAIEDVVDDAAKWYLK